MKNVFLTTAILLAMTAITPAHALEIGAGAASTLQVKTPGVAVGTDINAGASAETHSYRKPAQKEYDTTADNTAADEKEDTAQPKPEKKNGFSLYGEGSLGASGNAGGGFNANTETRTSGGASIGGGNIGGNLNATTKATGALR